jgi:hypothetical protein
VILENPIYRGEYVWNRSEWIKNHETGKRRRFLRPESEWVRQQSPAWEIVSAELWERVRSIAAAKRSAYVRRLGGRIVASHGQHGHSRHPLSGLLELANLARYVAKTGKVDAAAAQYAELEGRAHPAPRPADRATRLRP